MLKTFFVKLDIEKDIYAPAQIQFSVSSNDFDSVEVTFKIIQDDDPFDLSDKTVELGIRKPSGMTVYQNVEIKNAILGEFTAILSNQAYTEYGIHFAEIYIRDDDQMIVTPPFYFMSFESVMSDAIESTNEWSALQEVLFLYDKKPFLTNGIPTVVPEYVGQTAIDATMKILFFATEKTADSWVPVGAGGEGGTGIVTWETILGKPLTFPPDAHAPMIAEIEGLQLALDGKANAGEVDGGVPADHTHEINDVNGLQPALDSKSDNNHNHDLAYSLINHDHNNDYAPINHNHDQKYAPITHDHDLAYSQ